MNGILVKAISGFYYVNCSNIVYECKARGNFRKAGISPIVGDSVDITPLDSSHGVLELVNERKNLLSRPLVANIDKLFIVSSYSTPAPDTLMIDRLSAMACFNNIEPIIIFNKSDMGSFKEFYSIYSAAGFKTYVISARDNIGIEQLKTEMQGCVSAFSGNSGVGKSSILNALFPNLNLKTGEVSEKLGRGRHTTRHTELFEIENNGFVVDTPGFATVEAIDNLFSFKQSLPYCFPDFSDYIDNCKFTSCRHINEKGCALLQAISEGRVQKSRHDSYVSLMNELKDVNEWNTRTK